MELVSQTSDETEASEIRNQLEANGIPAFITNKNTHSLRKYILSGMGVFVHINSQKNEAILLINNPSYNVVNKIDVEKFYNQIKSGENSQIVSNYIFNLLIKVFGFLLLIGLIVIFIITKI